MDVKAKRFSEKLRKDYEDNKKKAKRLHIIFIGGSYKEIDKKYIEELRNRLRKEGLKAFLMEDIITPDIDFKSKFDIIRKQMHNKCNIPLYILYAGETAETSLNQTIMFLNRGKIL